MEAIKVLHQIKPDYNKNLIMTRLGYQKNATELTPFQLKSVEDSILRAEALIKLTVAYRFMTILNNDGECLLLEDGSCLRGKALAAHLIHCKEAVLMLSTAGKTVVHEIEVLVKKGEMSEAVILDAAASEITDAGLDFLMDYLTNMLRRTGRMLTKRRFSPGYGDFELKQQQDLAKLMGIERFDLSLNEACMLTPEKSVLAIAGIQGL